jgi:hypothetical protein
MASKKTTVPSMDYIYTYKNSIGTVKIVYPENIFDSVSIRALDVKGCGHLPLSKGNETVYKNFIKNCCDLIRRNSYFYIQGTFAITPDKQKIFEELDWKLIHKMEGNIKEGWNYCFLVKHLKEAFNPNFSESLFLEEADDKEIKKRLKSIEVTPPAAIQEDEDRRGLPNNPAFDIPQPRPRPAPAFIANWNQMIWNEAAANVGLNPVAAGNPEPQPIPQRGPIVGEVQIDPIPAEIIWGDEDDNRPDEENMN